MDRGLGVRSLDQPSPVDGQTRFEAASLTKPVVATATLRLAERGVLDLDRPLADILPYPRLAHDARHEKITPRHVLSHSSGLPNWGGKRLELLFDPGQRFSYSGEGFVFLQKALEHKLGRSLQQILSREIFDPLGMASSSVVWRDDFEATATQGHDEWGEGRDLRRSEEANAASSLITTATDYARFVSALLNHKLLEPDSWTAMFSPAINTQGWGSGTPEAQAHIDWGLGWGLERTDHGRLLWHWGDNGSFKCLVLADLSAKGGFVYFTNSSEGLSIAPAITDLLLPESRLLRTFLEYESVDAPGRALRQRLVLAFTGPRAGDPFALLKESFESTPLPEIGTYHAVSRRLRGLGQPAEAVRVLEEALAKLAPEVWSAEDFGDALIEARQYQKARETYQKAAGPAPPPIRKRLQEKAVWAEERLAIEQTPAPASTSDTLLKRYVGDYGPRQIRLSGHGLTYQRQGNSSYPLIAMGNHTFALDGLETFRIRFAMGPEGPARKIIGRYLDGTVDESLRSH